LSRRNTCRTRFRDAIHYSLGVFCNFGVPESEHDDSLFLQKFLSFRISMLTFRAGMGIAVEFDCKASLGAVAIEDESSKRVLPSEFKARQSPIFYQSPKPYLSGGRLSPHLPGKVSKSIVVFAQTTLLPIEIGVAVSMPGGR
jgi:hypothetical protein